MIRSLKIIAFLIFLCISAYSRQMEADSGSVIKSFSIEPETNDPHLSVFDTTMEVIHNYNPIYYNGFSQTFLGNTGQASITNNLDKRERNLPFMFSTPYQYYIYSPFNIYHFNTKKPFTELQYTTSGSRDESEQVLSALHTQNINPESNIGVLYDLIASKGIYNHQNTALNRIILFGSHTNEAYSMFTSLHYNGFKFQENGGLKNPVEFRNRQNEALNYVTNLNEANSQFRNLNLYLTQQIRLSSFIADSARMEKPEKFTLKHTINYNRFTRTYSDLTSRNDSVPFYRNHYYLTDESYDSAFHHVLSNRVDLNINLAGTQKLQTYLKHELKKFSYIMPQPVSYERKGIIVDTVLATYPKERFNDFSIGGVYEGMLKNWEYSLSGQFYMSGYRVGDSRIMGEFTRYFRERSVFVTMGGELSSQEPSFFLKQYGSSHFIWDNDFEKTEKIKAYAILGNVENFHLKLSMDFYNGLIFIDTLALPKQAEDKIFTATLKLEKKFEWGPVNHLHKLLLQKRAENYINVPFLAYQNSTWYENEVFNRVLKFRVGFDFYYFNPYFADAFMPATAMFYNQQTTEIGNYPFASGFIEFKLKRTRFSLQYTNALSELLPTADYFMAYQNPNFNSTIRFGLAWTFYD